MIGAIVLAAGRSRRMGTQKLLLPFGDRPLIARVVDEVLSSPVDRTLVVTGPDGDAIRMALAERPVTSVINPDPEGEMLGSVRSGLRALPAGCDAVLVLPGDLPGLDAEVVARLVEARKQTGRGLVMPVWNGRRGHPLLISTDYRDEILNQYEGVGLRGLLSAHPGAVAEVSVDSPALFEDMDVPDDYQNWLSRIRRLKD